ncbi:MAG: SPOR domain-containing protein [Demequina sp.]
MTPDQTDDAEYFFNTRTKAVEKGRQSSWGHLMGPYATREEAENALAKAEQRSEAWDEADEEWDGKD